MAQLTFNVNGSTEFEESLSRSKHTLAISVWKYSSQISFPYSVSSPKAPSKHNLHLKVTPTFNFCYLSNTREELLKLWSSEKNHYYYKITVSSKTLSAKRHLKSFSKNITHFINLRK